MTPADFPEANANYGPPENLEESQVRTVPAYSGQVERGSCEGLPQIVVAYDLSPEELEVLRTTGRIYLTMLGGLAPHFLTLSFHDASHPA